MFQIKAKLRYNKRVSDASWHCVLYAPRVAKSSCPGQFVNIRLSDAVEPLLRRPFSIHRVCGLDIEIMYQVVGKGTDLLSQKKPGAYLDVIGPLGNGFEYELPITNYRLRILVAGGMGVAPLIFLSEKLKEIPNPTSCRAHFIYGHSVRGKSQIPNLVLIGAKTKREILCEKEFKRLGYEVKIATDDGSRGFKGKVTDLLKFLLRTMNYELSTIYACGPRPMLKEISRISAADKIPAQISLEEHMACGIGACLGCAVRTKQGYQRVCKEGPVFGADEIIWE